MKKTIVLALLMTVGALSAMAQNVAPVRFEHGLELFPHNFDEAAQRPIVSPNELVGGHYIRYVQLSRVMNADERLSLELLGAKIIGYVHFGAYLTAFPEGFDLQQLSRFGALSIVEPKPTWKWAKTLREQPYGKWAVHGDYLDINVQVLPLVSIPEAADMLRRSGFDVTRKGRQNGYLEMSVHKDKLGELAALPYVQYLELAPPPGEKEDTRGRSLHRSNLIASESPLGKQYNGNGVAVLVRDDGQLGPHIDLQGRLFSFAQGGPTVGTHGDGVGGIIGGAGNLDPSQKGMAAGADVFDSDYEASFQDLTMDLVSNNGVRITNSSYSNGCNAGYTLAAQTVDQQIFDNPALMHVFSGGNSNGSNCNYGAGPQWGNITGGHKMAKNAIATANVFADATLVESSSRGPAHDGRLKPDISANGQDQGSLNPNNGYQVFGGTSGAAPGIAGCLAQLTQAYRAIHNEPEAPQALLKAAVLNTATDLGNPGPDFKFGWGHINAWRALRLLEQNNWLKGSVDQGAENTHSLAIPSNVKEAKIMIYWADPPSTTGTTKALVNDLDLRVFSATGIENLPWKLDPTPDPVILDTPAGKGRDSLNNVEQVQILNPAAGAYTIRVKGTEVPSGPQQYYIVWEFLRDEIKVTYPAGGEGFAPGSVERIHWDAYDNSGNFTLRYSTDGGESFFPLTNVGGDRRMFDWTVPNTVSGKVHILVIRGSRRDTSDIPFSIVPVPQNLDVAKVCPDSMWIGFSKINDTLSYDGYLLGSKYMELRGTSSNNVIGFPIQDPGKEKWYSVRASHSSGVAGQRAIAKRWPGGLLNCPQPFDLRTGALLSPGGDLFVACGATELGVTVNITNDGLNLASGATIHYQFDSNAPVTEGLPDIPAGATLAHTFQSPINTINSGLANLKIWVTLPNDIIDFNDTISIQFPILAETANGNFIETFEANVDFPPSWASVNPDNQKGWVTTEKLNTPVVGPDDTEGRSAHVDFFNYGPNLNGAEDYLYVVPVDLTGMENPTLSFKVAYARYNATFFDGLRVEVFSNCDLSGDPQVVWEKSGSQLATVPDQNSYFYPDVATDWRGESANLSNFENQTVVIRFVSVNGYGNSLYLDNIGVEDVKPPVASFSVPDTLCRLAPWIFEAAPATSNPNYVWLFGSGASPSSASGIGPHSVTYLTAGNKNIRLVVSNDLDSDTLNKGIHVRNLATANFTVAQNLLTATFTNTSTSADTYYWDFGDQTNSTEVNPVHTYAASGAYNVTLSATNACRTHDKSATVGVTSLNELSAALGLNILPNPNQGQFSVVMDSKRSGKAVMRLYDQAGRLLDERAVVLKDGQRSTVNYEESVLPKGAYQLQIQMGEQQTAYTIVVQ